MEYEKPAQTSVSKDSGHRISRTHVRFSGVVRWVKRGIDVQRSIFLMKNEMKIMVQGQDLLYIREYQQLRKQHFQCQDVILQCPIEMILFNFISFYTFYICCQHCKERLGTSPSRTNRKAGSPIIHIATKKQSKLQKSVVGEYRKC